MKTIIKILLILVVAIFIVVLGVRTLYPVKYLDVISEECEKYDADPALILAIIKAESNFDEAAISSKGAVGLMQLMPETAEWVKGKSGIEGEITDPVTNIKLGTWYFAGYLLPKYDNYDNNIELAAMAYNAGEGKVAQYDGNVPYRETNIYVKKTLANYEIYKKILKNK